MRVFLRYAVPYAHMLHRSCRAPHLSRKVCQNGMAQEKALSGCSCVATPQPRFATVQRQRRANCIKRFPTSVLLSEGSKPQGRWLSLSAGFLAIEKLVQGTPECSAHTLPL